MTPATSRAIEAAFLVGLCIGCAPTLTGGQGPRVPIPRDRLVAIPAFVDVFEVDSSDGITHEPEWTTATETAIDKSIVYRLSLEGARAFDADTLADLDDDADYDSFRAISQKVLLEIGWWPIRKMRHRPVYDWKLGNTFGNLQRALHADYVLISLFLDGHRSAGREAAFVLAPGEVFRTVVGRVASPSRKAIACLVDLRDGAIVGCAEESPAANLHERDLAQKTVDALISSLLKPRSKDKLPPQASHAPGEAAPEWSDPRDEALPGTLGPHEELFRTTDVVSNRATPAQVQPKVH